MNSHTVLASFPRNFLWLVEGSLQQAGVARLPRTRLARYKSELASHRLIVLGCGRTRGPPGREPGCAATAGTSAPNPRSPGTCTTHHDVYDMHQRSESSRRACHRRPQPRPRRGRRGHRGGGAATTSPRRHCERAASVRDLARSTDLPTPVPCSWPVVQQSPSICIHSGLQAAMCSYAIVRRQASKTRNPLSCYLKWKSLGSTTVLLPSCQETCSYKHLCHAESHQETQHAAASGKQQHAPCSLI